MGSGLSVVLWNTAVSAVWANHRDCISDFNLVCAAAIAVVVGSRRTPAFAPDFQETTFRFRAHKHIRLNYLHDRLFSRSGRTYRNFWASRRTVVWSQATRRVWRIG